MLEENRKVQADLDRLTVKHMQRIRPIWTRLPATRTSSAPGKRKRNRKRSA